MASPVGTWPCQPAARERRSPRDNRRLWRRLDRLPQSRRRTRPPRTKSLKEKRPAVFRPPALRIPNPGSRIPDPGPGSLHRGLVHHLGDFLLFLRAAQPLDLQRRLLLEHFLAIEALHLLVLAELLRRHR